MTTRKFSWSRDNREIALEWDDIGNGRLLLLLPALSSISTRAEMHPLMDRLKSQFRVVVLDWPGFGTTPRPGVRWTPDALSAYLQDAITALGVRPEGVIAAGHAATYVMGGDRPFFAKVRRLVEVPVLGPLLYRLNVNSFVIRHMVIRHVYSNPAWFTPQHLKEKRKVVEAAGARFASVGFVTGGLDRAASRAEFLDLASRAGKPILVVYGRETPTRSLAEMEALAASPGVESARLARGKLSVYEEFPDDAARAILPFLMK
jgi:pimeloyl-ACP methyl ester carboxylesterase